MTDCQIVLLTDAGRFDLHHVTGFGVMRTDEGWDGVFSFCSDAEWSRRLFEPRPVKGTLYQYVAEHDGSLSTYQFDGAEIMHVSGDSFRFTATRRRRI